MVNNSCLVFIDVFKSLFCRAVRREARQPFEESRTNESLRKMEIQGKIIQELGLREGVSSVTGKPWKMAGYVIETQEAYPKRMAFDVSDGESGRIERLGIRTGLVMKVYFDIDAREKDGRWYNTIRAFDARRVEGQ